MRVNCYHTVVLLVCLQCAWNTASGATYTAGVVEFAADVLQPTDTPQELIAKNTLRYLDIISTAAKHDVDIIVFPECGLTSIYIPTDRHKLPAYVTEIPEVGANPCADPHSSKVLQKLSCRARESSIYVVFNLDELVRCSKDQPDCPGDKHLFYNTNLAFDRNGTLVAKYRKFNLFIEPEFNVTKTPDHSWFDTDFGVRFGMFICFDIMFKEPTSTLLAQNISNFVYSTAWFSELPFLTAVPVQAGWAFVNDVNLLAGGYSNINYKNTGSGIFAGRDGKLTAIMPQHSTTKLLIAQVSSNQRGVKPSHTEEITFGEDTSTAMEFFHDSLTNYTTVEVTGKSATIEYENEGFSCKVTAELSTIGRGATYRLVAHSGLRTFAHLCTVRIEVCGVVACVDSKLSSCGYRPSFSSETTFSKISIQASSDKSLLSYPITMDKQLLSFPSETFQFRSQQSKKKIEMSMDTEKSQRNFITFAIFRTGPL